MKKYIALLLALSMLFALAACGTKSATTSADTSAAADASASADASKTGVEDGTLTIAMECAYAPYNWTQSDDSNGAVPIKDSSDYANGYDIMIAKKICEANGWKLEVERLAPPPPAFPSSPAAPAPPSSARSGMTPACPRFRAPKSSPPPKTLRPC